VQKRISAKKCRVLSGLIRFTPLRRVVIPLESRTGVALDCTAENKRGRWVYPIGLLVRLCCAVLDNSNLCHNAVLDGVNDLFKLLCNFVAE
jgi:hypothetical protein